MRRFIVIISFCIMGLVNALSGPARAGYKELKDTFDAFAPSAFYRDQSHKEVEEPKPVADPAFAEAKKQLQMMKSQWEKSLTAAEEKTVFLKPGFIALHSFKVQFMKLED